MVYTEGGPVGGEQMTQNYTELCEQIVRMKIAGDEMALILALSDRYRAKWPSEVRQSTNKALSRWSSAVVEPAKPEATRNEAGK